MIAKKIVPNVYVVSLGFVNVFLIDAGELTLVDTGTPGSEKKILAAIAELGYQVHDLHHILITHMHYDHTGSLEKLKQVSGAKIYMHALDAASYSKRETMRPVEPSPGLINKLIVKNLNRQQPSLPESLAVIDEIITSNKEIPATGGIQAIHTPGHTAGHTAYFWPKQNGVMFVGDAASNMLHLGYSILYENLALGEKTLSDLGQMKFSTACFSHGKTIQSRAGDKIREKFHQ
ncbi:MAG: MBL fold metallo-hydrolase [Anaerolineaceae bacterium]|nr:MBL fold metallo-hydrolase [Anaerolineaceae bacterium]